MLNSCQMCRLLLPLGCQQFGSPYLRYLVLFEICKHFEEDEKNRNVKFLEEVSILAAFGTATIWVTESPLPCVFLKFAKILKMQKIKILIKMLENVSLFAASGTATIWVTESPLPSFFNFKILRKIKKYDFQKSLQWLEFCRFRSVEA